MPKAFILILLFFVFVLPNSEQERNEAKITAESVCNINRTPQKYIGKEVKVLAVYKAAMMMPALLLDDNCEDLSLFVSYECKNDKICNSLKKRMKSAFVHGDISKQTVLIYFVGTLERNPNEGYAPIDGVLQNHTMRIKKFLEMRNSKVK